MGFEPPEGLRWLRDHPSGRPWLAELPALIDRAVRRWSLELGAPYAGGVAAFVCPAERRGVPVVLKVPFPDRESAGEPLALRAWSGDGAVRLLDAHQADRAMLLERCVPGTPLHTGTAGRALGIVADLLPRLWVPAPSGVPALTEEATRWTESIPAAWAAGDRALPERVVAAAVDGIGDLLRTTTEPPVLLHQDLHAGNVLAAEREPWLVIDPKPLAGERAMGLAPIVRGAELGATREAVLHRLDRLSASLDVDRERARRWTVAQTLAWGFADGVAHPWHARVATWLTDA